MLLNHTEIITEKLEIKKLHRTHAYTDTSYQNNLCVLTNATFIPHYHDSFYDSQSNSTNSALNAREFVICAWDYSLLHARRRKLAISQIVQTYTLRTLVDCDCQHTDEGTIPIPISAKWTDNHKR